MSDPTDYKVLFLQYQAIVHAYRDREARAMDDAQAIVKKYCLTGAVHGILPDHQFKPDYGMPMKMMEDIADALAKAHAAGATAQRAALSDGQCEGKK